MRNGILHRKLFHNPPLPNESPTFSLLKMMKMMKTNSMKYLSMWHLILLNSSLKNLQNQRKPLKNLYQKNFESIKMYLVNHLSAPYLLNKNLIMKLTSKNLLNHVSVRFICLTLKKNRPWMNLLMNTSRKELSFLLLPYNPYHSSLWERKMVPYSHVQITDTWTNTWSRITTHYC